MLKITTNTLKIIRPQPQNITKVIILSLNILILELPLKTARIIHLRRSKVRLQGKVSILISRAQKNQGIILVVTFFIVQNLLFLYIILTLVLARLSIYKILVGQPRFLETIRGRQKSLVLIILLVRGEPKICLRHKIN